jgi:heptaprenyl diphosphate synthase
VDFSKKQIQMAVFIALSMVLSLVETVIPLGFIFPGLKLGFANIATIVGLRYFNLKELLVVVILRGILIAAISGNFIMLAFSLMGSLLSTIVMFGLYKNRRIFSMIGISIAGAFFHNLGQMIVAYWMFSLDTAIFFIAPILFGSSLVTGYIIGYIGKNVLKNIESNVPEIILLEEKEKVM